MLRFFEFSHIKTVKFSDLMIFDNKSHDMKREKKKKKLCMARFRTWIQQKDEDYVSGCKTNQPWESLVAWWRMQ